MRKVSLLLFAVVAMVGCIVCPAQCSAEVICPWLNAATASGLLGDGVQVSVTAPVDPGPTKGVGQAYYADQIRADRFDVDCVFTRKTDSSVDSLRIEVKTMIDPEKQFAEILTRCQGNFVTLKGIGNQAVQCLIQRTGHNSSNEDEQVIARVRDRSFVLILHREGLASTISAGSGLRDDTRNIAEQVAGSLF